MPSWTSGVRLSVRRLPPAFPAGRLARDSRLLRIPRGTRGRARDVHAVTSGPKEPMSSDRPQVLVLDDDARLRDLLLQVFTEAGYRAAATADGGRGLELFREGRPDLAIVDVKMPMGGLDFLRAARALDPDAAIIMLTGAVEIQSAIECLKEGAADFILKPVRVEQILIAAERALERRHLLIERRQHQARLEHRVEEATRELVRLAHHDPLTGLPNRTLFREHLERALARADRSRQGVALLFLDLDGFKATNDTRGHDAGDALLRVVAERLLATLRRADILSRWGGDEFTVILEGVGHAEDAATVARKLLEAVGPAVRLQGQEVFVTTSIGIALSPQGGDDAETLTRNADLALFRAKEQGGNAFVFYRPEMTLQTLARLELQTALRRGVERGELRLHYQPQLDLRSGRIGAVEALLRWSHPERGLLPPGEFLAAAEESGQIVTIGDWALREVCAQLRRWEAAGLAGLRVAVSLSRRQFRPKALAESVARALAETGVAPGALELELSEQVLAEHVRVSAATLAELKALGVRICVDDFGTGYSSLASLRRLAIDRLKIDRSFVADLTAAGDAAAIATAVLALARSLGLGVIAEGVETGAQLEFLRAHGCDGVQGNFVSPPLPAHAVTRVLASSRALGEGGRGAGAPPPRRPRPR
jgi:diguanylate cyclase (GGDEF)-like protein